MRSVLRLAWWESRGGRVRLLVFALSIVFGTASIVAVLSFSEDLRRSVNQEAKSLLGADVVFRVSAKPNPEQSVFLNGLPGERADEISFTTMASVAGTGASRLVQIRAFDGPFPFYGEIRTAPPDAIARYQSEGAVIADPLLLTQLGLSVGDKLKIGEAEFPVIGVLEKIPGESPMWESIAPRVFVPMPELAKTNLLRFGSRATYKTYLRLPDDRPAPEFVASLAEEIRKNRFTADTVQDRRRGVERVMNNLEFFLSLAGVFSLMLGALGVAGGASIYFGGKRPAVAILRCLGARQRTAVNVFLAQIVAASFSAAVAGTLIGILVQYSFPAIFSAILPTAVVTRISWKAVSLGIGVGTMAAVWSCMQMLNELGGAPPLAVLRGEVGTIVFRRRRLIVSGLFLSALLLAVSVVSAKTLAEGLRIFAILLVAMAALRIVGAILVRMASAALNADVPYIVRQGHRNLARPGNQTALLSFAIGAVVLLSTTALLLRGTLVEQVRATSRAGGSDMILFDVQPDQVEPLREMLEARKTPVLDSAPVVTMRIQSVKGRAVRELLEEKAASTPEWTLRREYRSTYRGDLSTSERLLRGRLSTTANPEEPAAISLEEGIAEKLGVDLGDQLVFDVQGLEVKTVVGSIRAVDWQRLQPNFFVVFPPGVLEQAPQFHVFATRAGSEGASASLQRELVQEFPNISVFDLRGAIQVIEEILDKFAVVFDCIGASVSAAAFIVLCGTLYASFQSRMREQAILKAVGASPVQLLSISFVEFISLAVLGGLSGSVLAVGASLYLSLSVLKVKYLFFPAAVLLPLAVSALVTVTLGIITTSRVSRRSTLEVLRAE